MHKEPASIRREINAAIAILGTMLAAVAMPVVVWIALQVLAGRSFEQVFGQGVIDHLMWTIAGQGEALAVTFLLATSIIVIPSWSIRSKGIAIGAVLVCHTFVAWFCLNVRGFGGW